MIMERRVSHRHLFGGQTITWQAFDEEEAKKRGISYSYWKDIHYSQETAEKVPFFVLSDDGNRGSHLLHFLHSLRNRPQKRFWRVSSPQ